MTLILAAPPTITTADGAAWLFDDRPAVVTQIFRPKMDTAAATFLAGPLHEIIQARYFSGPRKVHFIHDWTACLSYALEARETLLNWGRAGEKITDRTDIVISPNASPFVRIALHTGATVMRGIGMKLAVHESLGTLIDGFKSAQAVQVQP